MWLRFRRLCLVVPTHQLSEVGKEVEKALRNGGNVRRKLRQSRAPQLVTVSHDVTDCRMKPAETWLGSKKVQRELKPQWSAVLWCCASPLALFLVVHLAKKGLHEKRDLQDPAMP